MRLSGAQSVWESLLREGVGTVFGYSGGSVIPLYHHLPDYPIRHVLVRHEQSAAHAADGYARSTGRVGVCLATSGPGATNLVTGLATAHADSSPVVAITGQAPVAGLGRDAFQEVYIAGIVQPVTKHGYVVKSAVELPSVIKEAFHIARSGRPGPVSIDITKDALLGELEFEYPDTVDLPGLALPPGATEEEIEEAARMIGEASRPLILAGQGITLAGAEDLLLQLAQTAGIPVATTLLGIGAFPQSSTQYLGRAGMHGDAHTNLALVEADLVIALGCRFSDRVTGTTGGFLDNSRIIHVDVDEAELQKSVHADLAVWSDVCDFLSGLVPSVRPLDLCEWWDYLNGLRAESGAGEAAAESAESLRPQFVVDRICRETNGEAIIVADVGQNQMWTAQNYRFNRKRGFLTSGGMGTMGFALPAALGAQLGNPGERVWVIAGDGGIQMSIQELATVVQENLPIKIAILNNGFLGMVRQWQELFYDKRYSATELTGPDFVRLAEAYGVPGIAVSDPSLVAGAIKAADEADGPALIDFRIGREENVFPMVAPGSPNHRMLFRSDSSRRSGGD